VGVPLLIRSVISFSRRRKKLARAAAGLIGEIKEMVGAEGRR